MVTKKISTDSQGFYDITKEAQDAVTKSGVTSGFCVVYCPHTTAGITINENADPDVCRDLIFALEETFPDRPEFRHAEGNSSAHLKASMIGSSATVIIEGGQLILGRWQAIYFCEFDGPRQRQYSIKVVAEHP